MRDIAVYGAGGFGCEIACLIKLVNESLRKARWNFIVFFDDNEKLRGASNKYGKILGGKSELNVWDMPLDIAVAIGSPKILKCVVEKIINPNITFPNIIAPSVDFLDESSVQFGIGNIICNKSVLSYNISLGNFNLLNVFTQLGHDSKIGNYNIIMPSVNISGGVVVGDCNLFGVKSTVLQYKKIGNNVNITPGSVMMRNGKDERTYLGNPAKVFM